MKKIVYKRHEGLDIVDCEIPKPKDKEVLVQVKQVSLCGSDYKIYDGTYNAPCSESLVIGHEWSGIVIETNNPVNDLKPGDRVTGECSIWCGKCLNCSTDKNLCENIEKFGITKDGFAVQFQTVDSRFLHKAPDNLDFDVLALAEPLAVAMHGIRKLEKSISLQDKKVAVIGGGSIGICIYLLLKDYFMLKDVVIFEKNDKKAEYLKNMFQADVCTDYVLKDDISYQSLYQKQNYDLAFEASGTGEGIKTAVSLLKTQGKLCLYGLGNDYLMDMKNVVLKGIEVTGTIGGTGEFETIIEFIGSEPEKIRKLITKKFHYTRIKEILDNYKKDTEPVLKRQMYFGGD